MSKLCPHCREYDIPDEDDVRLPRDREEEYKETIALLKMAVEDAEFVIDCLNKELEK